MVMSFQHYQINKTIYNRSRHDLSILRLLFISWRNSVLRSVFFKESMKIQHILYTAQLPSINRISIVDSSEYQIYNQRQVSVYSKNDIFLPEVFTPRYLFTIFSHKSTANAKYTSLKELLFIYFTENSYN